MIDENELKKRLSERIKHLGGKTQVTDWDYILCVVFSVINELKEQE